MKTVASKRGVSVTPEVLQMLMDKESTALVHIFDTDNFQNATLLKQLLLALILNKQPFTDYWIHPARISSLSLVKNTLIMLSCIFLSDLVMLI